MIHSDFATVDYRRRLIPRNKSIFLLAGFACTAIVLALIAQWIPAITADGLRQVELTLLASVIILMALDWRWARRLPPVQINRRLATGLALNQWTEVTLEVRHQLPNTAEIEVYDHLTSSVVAEGMWSNIPLQADQTTSRSYRLRPLRRGLLVLERCHVRHSSPLGLWLVQYQIPIRSEAKVYPDFAAISTYTVLASENHTSQLGIRRKNRRGQGLDFHQLREYRQGDSLRQLDWKATARRQALISKDYQDERDQNVVLLIDSGRRMRSKDDDLDHFDHALNASLLIAYIALRQGDSVGVMTFGSNDRWINPQKGSNRVNVILNGLYDLQTSNRAPDYLSAAERLTQLQRKRSLVILVTNSRDEELDELTLAIHLLRRRHVVLVANIREAVLDQTLYQPVENYDDAVRYAGTVDFINQRLKITKRLSSQGIFAVDCLAKELPAQLANSYWDIKRTGAL